MEAYGEHVLSETRCREWFRPFKSGNFDVEDKDRPGQPKRFEDPDLQALLDVDDGQTQQKLAEQLDVDQSTVSRRLTAMGKILKVGEASTNCQRDGKNARKNS